MKKLCLTVLILCISSAAFATTWSQVDFTCTLGGAMSYDQSGDNVVTAGTAFYDTITSGGYLGTQLIGGDGVNQQVSGNFAVYGLFSFSDTANVLSWVAGNANTLFAYEFRAWSVNLDFNNDNLSDYTESFTLNATDMPGVDYLKATFNDLSTWGYTEMAPGVFVDLAIGGSNCVALSIVIDGFATNNWSDVNARILPGVLQGYTPGVTPGSGIRVAMIPEPATMCILAIGSLIALRKRK
ncbi:MAG: hypothetical protein A2Y12_05070 [Planctomycetes bacterium GWF2_42_9]|nr:MAG: hypothetical protein A2Y12_05070 [Planctomycetes bacterium GWF2_42_9]HAL44706.1 hypothetical protein [Phycisphaerales bacterium]